MMETLELAISGTAAREDARKELEELQLDPDFRTCAEETLQVLDFIIKAEREMEARLNQRNGPTERVSERREVHEGMRTWLI